MYITQDAVLQQWKSPKVKDLLLKFYEANFIKAGVDPLLANKIIEEAWLLKEKHKVEDVRLKINAIFNIAKTKLKDKSKEINPLDLFDFSNIKTFLDFGANRLDTINFITRKYPYIEKLIAIDVIPQIKPFKDPARSEYYQIDPGLENFPIYDNSVDVINIQFVLHHFPNEDLIHKLFNHCYKALRTDGKLILWEESFEERINLSEVIKTAEENNIDIDENLTKQFYELNESERKEFILANDWLINVNNSHMQWSTEYRSWKEWVELLKEAKFELLRKYNLGLRASGRLKQGVHMTGEFTKS